MMFPVPGTYLGILPLCLAKFSFFKSQQIPYHLQEASL